jgi:RNA polymerase sigma factor (sigma-70 family)
MPMTTANISYAPTGATLSPADLLVRVGDRDPAAWDEVVHRYGRLISATVHSFRLQDADTLDAVQMTWLRLAEHAHQIQEPERLGGWLATTARRECLHILRHPKPTPDRFDAVAETTVDPVGPEQRVIDADTTRTLWNFVSELSPRQQALLRALFTAHPQPYAEVARITGIPPGGIGPTRARALAQLRDKLEQHGVGPGAWR